MSHHTDTLVSMQQHIDFIEDTITADFRIDERTKAVGRQGIAAARARLASINPTTTTQNTPRSHAA